MQATFIVAGSLVVGMFVGGFGILVLRSKRWYKLKHHVFMGAILGAAVGGVFNIMFYHPGDPWMTWPIFTTLPTVSMMLGFVCYWFLGVRGSACLKG